MRYQKTQLILIGAITFIHIQLFSYINWGTLWLNPRSLLWPMLIPCALWCVGEMVKLKRQMDREDGLAPYYLCSVFLWEEGTRART